MRSSIGVIVAALLAPEGAADPAGGFALARSVERPDSHWHVQMDQLYEARGYRWHEAEPGESIQFGVPQSDDRALRVDCSRGRIVVIGPADASLEEGSSISVVFDDTDRRDGRVAMLGDGANFVVEMAREDPLLGRLLSQRHIIVDGPGIELFVPTAGGVALIQALIASCRA